MPVTGTMVQQSALWPIAQQPMVQRHTSTIFMRATLQSPPALGGPRIQKKVEVPSNLQLAGEVERVPGGKGRAVKLQEGQYLKVTNTHGEQVVDFFGFGLPDIRKEMMSMHHTHDAWGSLVPKVGDTAVTNLRRPIFTLVEDTGPGVHDTTVAACDQYLYIQQIGPEAAKEHDSCINNLHTSLKRDVDLTLTDDPDNYPPPAPFNLWMAVSLNNNGTELSWDPPAKGQKAGDHVLFKVEMDCVAVMSACPHDLSPINGKTGPNDVHFQVFNAA
eukprot:jgi/Astpho2/8240/fgenesh1_pg.00122_%23_19_t